MNDLKPITDTTAQLSELLGMFMIDILRCDTADMLRLLKREDLSMPRIAALNVVEQFNAG